MIRVGWFVRFGLVCALLVGLLPVAFSGPVAHAQSSAQAGSWYRYQGEPSSYDEFDNQQVNCGPTAVASAIQYSLNLSVPIKDIRALIGKNKAWTHYSDLTRALSKWNVKYAENIRNVDDLRGVVDRGNVAIVGADMRKISPGADVNGASTDPSIRIGRYETTATDHWFVVKGVSADGKYFIVYDGNVWSGPGTAKYWYSDGTPKGLDRYYLVSEVAAAMGRLAPNVVKGVEITSGSRPNVEQGQSVDATVTYYTAGFEETQKRPGDPGWGIMYNGKKVHWGAVAVDPEYIPLGTKLKIAGWGDKVFTAEDTGSGVKGWHVDVFWTGTRLDALKKNDEMGGVRKITLLGDGPTFVDQAGGMAPSRPVVRIDGEGTSLSRFVKLQLSATEAPNNPTGMMISNSAHFTDAFEEPFAPEKEWTLTPGDGPQTVYVRFKNSSGAWSEVGTAGIDLQERPPVGSVTVAPDPQLLLSARLSGNALPSLGPQPKTTGQPLYRPLGPNLLANSSFESWAGGIPASWDSELRDQAHRFYEPTSTAFHGSLAVLSASSGVGSELVQKVIIKPNAHYTISAQVQGAGGKMTVEELETQGVVSRSLRVHELDTQAGDDWRRISMTFKSSPSATDAAVRLIGTGVHWDALQLEEGNRSSAYRADGVLLEGGAMNVIANSGIERGSEGWSGLNSWVQVVSSPDYARFGRKALLVHKSKAGKAATVHAASVVPKRNYTYSTYVRLESGRPITNDTITGWIFQGADSVKAVEAEEFTDENRPEMIWKAVGGGWYRGSFTFQANGSDVLIGVLSSETVEVGEEFYLDAAQLEPGLTATSYVDGDFGAGFRWLGLPYNSPAVRSRVGVSYRKTVGSRGSLVFWARPEQAATDGALLLSLGELNVRVRDAGLELRVADQLIGVAPWTAGAARMYAVAWDGEYVWYYASGKLVGMHKATPPTVGSTLALGPVSGWAYPNAVVGDVSLWRKTLEAPEVRYLGANAPLDPGLASVNTQYTQVATKATDSTEGDIRIEWSENGKSWQVWEHGQGLHDWDLGAAEGLKTVWVRFTDSVGNWLVYNDTVQLDRTAPKVLRSRVEKGAVVVEFSEPVALQSVHLSDVLSGGAVVEGSWRYKPGETVATFHPKVETFGPLGLVVPTGLIDVARNHLAEPYTRTLQRAP